MRAADSEVLQGKARTAGPGTNAWKHRQWTTKQSMRK